MATIQPPQTAGFDIDALAPAGTYIATCLEVQDQFGVERPKFENPQEKEILDVTRFLFGFKGQDGRPYKVQSFEFRISGSPKSNLFKFLTSWLGSPPKYGWDYCELQGQGAMITVAHKQSRDGTKTYANLVGISPVIDQLKAQVLPIEAFQVGTAVPSRPPEAPQPPAPGSQVPVLRSSQSEAGSAPAPQQPQPSAGGYQQQPPQPPQPSAPSANSAVNPPQPAWNPAVDSDVQCPF